MPPSPPAAHIAARCALQRLAPQESSKAAGRRVGCSGMPLGGNTDVAIQDQQDCSAREIAWLLSQTRELDTVLTTSHPMVLGAAITNDPVDRAGREALVYAFRSL